MNNSEILKFWDLFPSPAWIVELLVEAANIELGISCLEPSAGFGTLATSLQQAGAIVEVVEPISELQTILSLQGLLLVGADFLTTPSLSDRYERVVQNPPFSQQITHVKRAYQCLKVGGRLVSLVSHSPWRYNTSFYKQFRYWLNTVNAQVQELPWGLFVNSERYTSVECCLIIIDKI